MWRWGNLLLGMVWGAGLQAAEPMQVWLEQFEQSELIEAPSIVLPQVSNKEAYAWQRKAFAVRFGDAIPAGYKLALATPQAQARFKADGPLFGVLPPQGNLPNQAITIPAAGRLMMEAEVAVVLTATPPDDVSDWAAWLADNSCLAPALEWPWLRFQSPKGLNGKDLIIANVAAYRTHVGACMPDPESPPVMTMMQGDAVLHTRPAWGPQHPRQRARWLLEQARQLNWPIHKGQVLLTGVIGPMKAASEGTVTLQFQEWADMHIEVQR